MVYRIEAPLHDLQKSLNLFSMVFGEPMLEVTYYYERSDPTGLMTRHLREDYTGCYLEMEGYEKRIGDVCALPYVLDQFFEDGMISVGKAETYYFTYSSDYTVELTAINECPWRIRIMGDKYKRVAEQYLEYLDTTPQRVPLPNLHAVLLN